MLRDYRLELLRGIGALLVLLDHCSAAFSIGILPAPLIDGAAAVTFFFVLSGYVLIRSYAQTRSSRYLWNQVAKRVPRLGGPVFVIVIFSAVIVNSGQAEFATAGKTAGSVWLAHYGGAQNIPTPSSLGFILKEATYGSLFLGHAAYASPLWTISYELIGSMVVYGSSFLFVVFGRPTLVFCLLITTMLIGVDMQPYVAMLCGTLMSFVLKNKKEFPVIEFIVCLTLGVWLLFYGGLFAERFLPGFRQPEYFTYEQIAGSILILLAFEKAPHACFEHLSRYRAARFLGFVSFPLYLSHLLIIVTVGSLIFIQADRLFGLEIAKYSAFSSTIVISLTVSLPLAFLDKMWRSKIDGVLKSFYARKPSWLCSVSSCSEAGGLERK